MTNAEDAALDLLAAEPIDDLDVAALRRMAGIYDALDPVPRGMIERIQFAMTLEALHAEVAELQHSAGLAGVRSGEATETQTVTFTSPSLTTMVTITPTGADEVRIDGWVAPGAVLDVELRVVGSVLTTRSDGDGRFVFDAVPRGMAQFVLRPLEGSSHPPVVTPSIDL
jgi:hypothetical protein